MATMIVVVRIVSPEQFGVWAVALTAHSILANSAELGVGSLLIRRDTDVAALAGSASFIALASSGLFAAMMALTAPWIAAGLGSEEAAPAIRVMALSVFAVGLFSVPNALLAREFRQRALFGANVTSLLVGNAVLLGLALGGAGPLAFAWSVVAGQLAAGAVTVRLAGRWYPPVLDRAVSGMLLRFGVPLAAANAFNYAFLNLDYAVIGRLRGAAALGGYLLAFNISSWPYSILGASINTVSMPAFSDSASRAMFQRRIEVTAQTVAAIAFPAAAIIAALSGPLVATLYGSKWEAAGPVLSLLAPYGACFLITLVLGNALVAAGRSMTLLMLQALWLIVLVPVMAALVDAMGSRGAAVAHLLVLLAVIAPAYLVVVRKTIGVDPWGVLGALVAPLGFAVIAGGAAWATSTIVTLPLAQLLVGSTAGSAVYGTLASPILAARMGSRIPWLGRPLGVLAHAVERGAQGLALGWMLRTPSERTGDSPVGEAGADAAALAPKTIYGEDIPAVIGRLAAQTEGL